HGLQLRGGGGQLGLGLLVHAGDVRALAPEQARRGQAALADPSDHHARACELGEHGQVHRSLIASTATAPQRMATIQNRTMIFGSGTPLSSKWWWTGAILNTRRPVSLKDITWIITERISAKNTPLMMAETTSFLDSMASAP